MLSEPVAVTLQVTSALENLGVPYVIGGSMASTAHGRIRTTMDVDIVAQTRYKLINSKEVKKVLKAEGEPDLLQMPKKFDKLPEPVQDVGNG